MAIKIKSKVLKGIFTTFANQATVAFLQVFQLQVLSRILSENQLGAFLVIRRFIGISCPIFTLNLGDSMARYNSLKPHQSTRFLASSIFIVATLVLCSFFFSLLFPTRFSELLFGDSEYTNLIPGIFLFLFANTFLFLFTNYFRGKQNFSKMNKTFLYFWIVSVLLIVIFFLPLDSFILKLNYYLLATSISTILLVMVMLLGEEQYSVLLSYVCNFKSTLINSGQDFFKYGITRLPNNFFFGSLFFIPVVIASNYCDLKTAAYVGVLLTIIRMLQILALPINIIVVPKIAELKSLTKHSEIKEHANNILHFILSAPMWIGLYVMLFAREVILIWFGEKYSVLISSIEWVGAISGFLLVFVVIRGMLDGISSRPYINYITFVAFAVLITSFLLKGLQNTDYHSIALAFGISLTTLGLSSVIFYTLVFKLSIVNKINFYLASWYFISIFIMNYVAKYCHQYEFVTSLAVKIIIGAVYLFVSLIFLNYLQVGWIKELKQRFSL